VFIAGSRPFEPSDPSGNKTNHCSEMAACTWNQTRADADRLVRDSVDVLCRSSR
jgi:hypothetical protein